MRRSPTIHKCRLPNGFVNAVSPWPHHRRVSRQMMRLSDGARGELDGILRAYPPQELPGTVVALVGRHGEELFLGSSGVNDMESGEPMRADTVFPIFSCTKVITAMACMQAVEGGIMKLDEPVTDLLPELAHPSVITGTQGDDIMMKTATTPITLRMLLTHTAGFSYSWYHAGLHQWVAQQKLQFSDKLHLSPLVNEPGTKWEYGMSMDWAGAALRKASGKSLGEWSKEHIFDPLGLNDTSFDPVLREGRNARLHVRDGLAGPSRPSDIAGGIAEVPLKGGGGGAYSTASEFLQVLVPLLNEGKGANGNVILRPETVRAMFEDQMPILDISDLGGLAPNGAVPSADPKIAGSALEMLPGERKGWGLSFLLNPDDVPQGRKAGSAEWVKGGVANLWWLADPTTGVAGVVFNSILPYGQPEFVDLETKVQEIIYRAGSLI